MKQIAPWIRIAPWIKFPAVYHDWLGKVRLVLLLAGLGCALCSGLGTASLQGQSAPAPAATNLTTTDLTTTNLSAAKSAEPAPGIDMSIWVLTPNDQLAMTVYQEEDLSAKVTVDANGKVMLPLLGEVSVGGLTLAQATKQIQTLYDRDYLVNPQVNLVVEKFATRRFAVLGEVQRPGSYDFPENEQVNLLEAIAMAGGYTRLGAPSKVTVRRVENGATKIYRVDAERMAQDLSRGSFRILPNDLISVGERIF